MPIIEYKILTLEPKTPVNSSIHPKCDTLNKTSKN